jgi:2-methylisocitrate lyase-like PEP mutase family enzyme
VERAGAKAIATGSWSVAAAQGYEDGEMIPLDFVERIVQRICTSTTLPVTVDFEGGYATAPAELAANVMRIVAAGAVGINFEDQVVNGSGLYDVSTQCERLAAIRDAAEQSGVALYINARTDLFLQATDDKDHAGLLDEAKTRADAYDKAGASGLFVPGLKDGALIDDLCRHTGLPVNIMMKEGVPSPAKLAALGVSRISYGPAPFRTCTNALKGHAEAIYMK